MEENLGTYKVNELINLWIDITEVADASPRWYGKEKQIESIIATKLGMPLTEVESMLYRKKAKKQKKEMKVGEMIREIEGLKDHMRDMKEYMTFTNVHICKNFCKKDKDQDNN